jgi:2-desacetyl-2-hydroxyethyl bacteriochlorophyllide A dehydrogenase
VSAGPEAEVAGTGTSSVSSPPTRATMRRVVVSAGSIDVVRAAVPGIGPGQALVRSEVVGICGSDTHASHGRHPFIRLPYHPGHEVVGVVEAVAPAVTSVAPGQRVTVEPDLPCWACKPCRSGRENLCENLTFFGCGWEQGGMAEYFTIPADRLHRIPDDLDLRSAALIEPLSTPVHAVRIVGDVTDRAVVVLGAGTIGLLLLRVLRAHRTRRIVVTDVLAAKRERALRLGADAVVDARAEDVVARVRGELGESADVVFDCVANASTLPQAIAMAGKGGTVAIVGVPTEATRLPVHLVQDHQIRLQGSATYLPEDYAESITLLRSGSVAASSFVTAVRPLDCAAEAFTLSAGGEHVKVLVAVDPAAAVELGPVGG